MLSTSTETDCCICLQTQCFHIYWLSHIVMYWTSLNIVCKDSTYRFTIYLLMKFWYHNRNNKFTHEILNRLEIVDLVKLVKIVSRVYLKTNLRCLFNTGVPTQARCYWNYNNPHDLINMINTLNPKNTTILKSYYILGTLNMCINVIQNAIKVSIWVDICYTTYLRPIKYILRIIQTALYISMHLYYALNIYST